LTALLQSPAGSVLLLVHDDDADGARRRWTLAAVLMVVNWVPSYFLSVLVDRLLGVAVGV
jgi:hypothetical protein